MLQYHATPHQITLYFAIPYHTTPYHTVRSVLNLQIYISEATKKLPNSKKFPIEPEQVRQFRISSQPHVDISPKNNRKCLITFRRLTSLQMNLRDVSLFCHSNNHNTFLKCVSGTMPYDTKPHYTLPHPPTTPHHTIPYHTIPYHTIPYHTIPYHTIPYLTMPCHAMPCHAMPCHAIPYHTIPYHTIQHTIQHTIPYHTIQHTIQHTFIPT